MRDSPHNARLYNIKGKLLTSRQATRKYGIPYWRFQYLLKNNKLDKIELPDLYKRYNVKGEMLTAKEAREKYNCDDQWFRYCVKHDCLYRIDIRGHLKFPVKSRGKVFADANECAKYNNCSVKSVKQHLVRGTADNIGVRTNPNFKQELADYKASLQ